MASIEEILKTNFKDDKQKFVANMVHTTSWIKNTFNELIKPFGISSQQFNILRILRGAGDWLSMNIVKERMVEKSPNATRLADKLLDKDLIERERCSSDRRVVFVKITDKGLALLAEVDKLENKDFMAFISKITPEEAKQFSDILDKMRE